MSQYNMSDPVGSAEGWVRGQCCEDLLQSQRDYCWFERKLWMMETLDRVETEHVQFIWKTLKERAHMKQHNINHIKTVMKLQM